MSEPFLVRKKEKEVISKMLTFNLSVANAHMAEMTSLDSCPQNFFYGWKAGKRYNHSYHSLSA